MARIDWPTRRRVSTTADPVPLHVPAGLDPRRPAPLICMLHGCTQDPTTFAAATRMDAAADRHGFVVAYPGQSRRENPQGCWNWFQAQHQRRDGGEPAVLASLVRRLLEPNERCTLDPGRVYVAGLSAGGAMAVNLATCYPDLVAAVAVHSGLAFGAATSVAAAFSVMARGGKDLEALGRAARSAMGARARRVPTMVVHGSADRTVAPINGRQVLEQSMLVRPAAGLHAVAADLAHPSASGRGQVDGGLAYTWSRWTDGDGRPAHALLEVDGLGHAWSGGAAGGSFADPRGPDASEAICRFFAEVGAPAGR